MKNTCKRLIAALLSICLLCSILPLQIWAEETQTVRQGEQPASLITPEGEIAADEDWNEAYPYGTFAFGTYQADVAETGALSPEGEAIPQTALLPVYRIGGTIGRVTARITYAPAVTTDESGTGYVYDYAASGKSDLLIEAENPNSLAAYQQIGLPEAERKMQPAPEVSLEAVTDGENRLVLNLNNAEQASGWRWQYRTPGGFWKNVDEATEPTLELTWEDYSVLGITSWEDLDFRCILTVEDALFCTISLKGERFTPWPEASAVPEELELPEEPGYTAIAFENDYDMYAFDLTFADGETVQYIRVTALDDELPELPELGLFTIIGCEGGELSELCNTLTLMVSDNDEGEPSELGFTVSALTVNRETGVAEATVRRTGGTSYNVTVDYETVDGSAKAGVDYAAKHGTLAFAGSIDEITIPIELISNEDTGEKSFSLKLSNVKGGGTAELCKLGVDTLSFTLAGESPKGELGQNLASVLSGHDGTEAASRVRTEQDALIPDATTQQGQVSMEQDEPLSAKLTIPDGTRSHTLNAEFHFSRDDNYANSTDYWHDWEIINGSDVFATDAVDTMGYGTLWSYGVYSGKDKEHETVVLNDPNGGVDKNGNSTYIRLNNRTGTDVMRKYLEISANYKASASIEIPGAGKLFDEVQLIAYLEGVGTKKKSKDSRYLQPLVQAACTPYGNDLNDYASGYPTPFYVTSNDDMQHWMISGQSNNLPTYWKLVNPRQDGDYSTEWPDSAFLESFPMRWENSALYLKLGFYIFKQWNMKEQDDFEKMQDSDQWTVVDIPVFRAKRRVLTKTNQIPIVIYTANDSDEAEGTGWTALPGDSIVYSRLAPTLSLVAKGGGVNDYGQLYAGSAFTVNIDALAPGYIIPENGLFITNEAGVHVGTVNRIGESLQWKVTMDWDGMTEADLNQKYQINVLLERSQPIKVDLYPSIGDNQTEAFNCFTGEKATVQCSVLGSPDSQGKYFSEKRTYTLNGADYSEVDNANAVYSTGKYNNIQSINFHQDPEDIILYHGRAYAGNETIPVMESDLGSQELLFVYYGKDYLDQISDMRVNIDHVELYYDKDGSNGIDGSIQQGVFVLDKDNNDNPKDELITARLNGDYPDSFFKPVVTKDENGNDVVHQYYMKVFFTLRPKAYNVPVGASSSDRAQILPALASAVTDEAGTAALTPEQQSYRYLRGANTDGHPMYGAAATELSYVDIPLGGDTGSVFYESISTAVKDKNGKITGVDTTETYTWTPKFVGNLLVNFDRPTPVIDTNNITGHPVSMAGKEIPYNSSTKRFEYVDGDGSEDAMNAFLGAMVGRSTFVVGVQEQKRALADIDSLSMIEPQTITMGSVSTTPNADSVMNLASGGDAGGTDGSTPGDDAGYPEFGADLGTELPSLELELGDYATLIIDGYQVGFAIGIPIYKYEDTNYSGTHDDGSTSTSYEDDDVHHETITSKDGKTVTNITVTPDENNSKVRTVVTETVVTDDKGNQTRKRVTEEQEYLGKKQGWICNGKKTEDNNPPAPSQNDPKKTAAENFKQGFGEANGQMQTLADFVSACKSRNLENLKDFMKGAWKDDSLENAKNGNCTSTKVEVSFTVQISIMFEYNPIDNCHFFKSAGLSASLGIELSAQHRFSFFPLAYVYVKLGIEVEVAVSLSCIRNPKLGAEITDFRQGSLSGLSQGSPVVFALDMSGKNPIRGFHIDLLGTVYMEIYDNPSLNYKPISAGTLSGDGSEKEVLLEAYDKTVYIRLTPLRGQVFAENLRPVTGASSKVVFDGLNITPSIELEAGVGIGVELLKFELFVKTSIAITMTMGGYLEDTDKYEGFYISDFQWGLCVGFNVTALFFNYSMEAIGISVEGTQKGTHGYFSWEIKATALDGNKELWSKNTYTAADGKSLGTEEPEELTTPNESNFNLGPKDPGCSFNGVFDGSNLSHPLNLNVGDDFPENCGWELKENMNAYGWYGGAFQGEIPMDKDVIKATKDKVSVEIDVPAETGKILVYFDGTVDYKVYNSSAPETVLAQKENIKKSPVEISVGQDETIVKLSPTKGTLIDRWAINKPKTEDPDQKPSADRSAPTGGGLIHVSAPTDVSATQQVTDAKQADARAFTPNGTADFELSGFNTAGDAKKLISGLSNGYSYKLFQADGEKYILYPLMLDGAAQLVLSKLVMTGDLTQVSGLEHPTDPTAFEPWLKVDNDSFGDLDYNVSVDGNTITAVWSAYTGSASGSAVESAKQIAIKRATLTLGTDAAFSAPTVLSEDSESYRFLPAQVGLTTVWAESSGSSAANNQRLAAYLIATNPGLTQEILDARTTENALLASAVYRWVLQSDLNAIYGAESVLTASTGASAAIPNEYLENIEIGSLGGKTLALYSTSQAAYFDSAEPTPITVSPEQFNADTELATIRRLYLREVNGESWGEPLLLETVIDFDGCTDDNLESRALQDGIYIGGSLQTAQADPYFGNFRFLTADLDGTGSAETLLLFEMGGNSYLLRQADALALLSGGEGSILPIFEQTTGSDVSIGSDGENLAIVYTAAVPGSLSNAIYTAWWDRSLGTWGSPTILAMRHLQVYEDGIKYDMEPKELEKAYLGKLSTPAGNTGSMYRLQFSDLQMSTRTVARDDGAEGKQLLVLTGGSLQKLRSQTLTMPSGGTIDSVAPDGSTELGFYAIAFGVGDQALGEGKLSLAQYDFTFGKRLVGGLSFVNTGTTAIRGSKDNPITICMHVNTGTNNYDLATWKLTDSIPSGGTVELSFRAQDLKETLPAGSTFWVEVKEDPAYFGADAFSDSISDLLTVEARPELSITDFRAELLRIDQTTGKAYLDLNATVLNTGNADANGVYIQFAYDTGEKDAGLAVYKPVDIQFSNLSSSAQQAKSNPVLPSDANGVYQLIGPDTEGQMEDRTSLKKGCYRTVTGELAVPISCFVSLEEFSGLHLRAEVYSDFDSPNYDNGLYSSDHNEYNGTNNRAEQILKHQTFFHVPNRISTALGTTLTLPVSFESTGTEPELVLTEISDGTEGWEPRMGICYYDPDRKVIVAAPNSKAQQLLEDGKVPTGILQIKDVTTNSLVAITYKVGAMADGVNIYKDDASFVFHDANGNLTDLNAAAAANPGWMFLDKGVETGWLGGDSGEIPMNNDLSLCNQDGAYFTFETVADKLSIYFMGELTVESGVFGTAGTTQPFTISPAVIDFGNDTGLRHTITVTGKAGTRIDRYVAEYKTNTVPDTDPNAPQILWNRSFPETASLLSGQSVPMTCYIVDASGLKTVSFNNQTLSETTTPALVKLDDGLWYFDYTFNSNGAYTVRATDLSDNSSKGTVGVDWFNDVLSAGAIADAPALTRSHLGFVDGSGNAVPTTGSLTAAPFLKSSYTLQSNELSAAYLFTDGAFSSDPLGKATGERWLANWNGYYQMRVEREDGTWARAITLLSNLDLTPPSVTPELPGNGTPDNPYLIGSREDWLKLQAYVNGGNSCVGLCFRQTANIAVIDADMIGTEGNPFTGNYDGSGYTLSLTAANAPECFAPFRYAENAAFRNLRVDGELTTMQKHAAGILANASGICSFYNCRVSMTIHSDINGEGGHGGLVGYSDPDSTITVTGCTVDGSFLGVNTTLCGGFAGCCNGSITIRDSIFAPAVWEWTESQNFYRWQGSAERSMTNCYYLVPGANDQGSRGYAVTAGTDVALTRTGGTAYDVAGLYALSAGLFYNDALRAAAGETVSVLPYYTGNDPDNAESYFLASAGAFTKREGSGYSLTMPAEDVVINVGTHEWDAPSYVWAEDNSKVTARRVCIHNASHYETETVNVTSALTQEPTCINAGKTTYTATFTNPAFETQTRTLPDIPALGHEWGEPSYTWADDNSTATAIRVCLRDSDHVQRETVETTAVVTKPATCTEPGETTYTAVFTNVVFETQSKTVADIPASGHAWSEPCYTWADDNSTVTAFRSCANDASHDESQTVNTTSEVTQEPTCINAGKTTYTAIFTNPAFETQTRTLPDIPALGHEWGEPSYTWADDNSTATAIRVCLRDSDHVQRETVETTAVVTKPATCTEPGETTYTAVFTNAVFETQTKTVADVDPIGHDYQLSDWSWEGFTSATANFVCSHDASHTMSLEAEISSVRTEPNCTESGKVVYTASVTYNGWNYTNEKTEILPATGHDYVLTAWSWEQYSAASAIFTCQHDAGHVETVAATITSVRTEPTPEEDGSVVYTATVVFEGKTYTDTKTEILPAIGHDYELTGWSWEGYTKATASFIDRNGGDPITVEATIQVVRTEPGCESSGMAVYTATVTLNEKTYTDSKTETLEALGHDWGEASYEWAEDYSSVTATVVCRRDESHVLTKTVTPTYIITKPSTYKEDGIGTYTAEFENELFTTQSVQIVIPAISCDGGDNCPSARFTDVPGVEHWMHLPVDWAVVNKITAGTSETTFSPYDTCTRAQFVTFLWRTSGSPESTLTDNPFEDVTEEDYYYKAVLWAVENGITAGVSTSAFGPHNPCTRAQIVTFLWRMEGSEEPTITETPFEDLEPEAYYLTPVYWAYENEITSGTSETTFSPDNPCSRAEAVTFLYQEFAK